MAFEPVTREALRIGLYIKIEGSWFSHPFPTNAFKIRYSKEVDTLRGLKHVKLFYDPDRSDPELPPDPPLPETDAESAQAAGCEVGQSGSEAGQTDSEAAEAVVADLVQRKRDLQDEFKHYQAKLERVESEYKKVIRNGKTMIHDITAKRNRGITTAKTIVETVQRLVAEPQSSNALMNVMDSIEGNEEFFLHALNVCVLSVLIGRDFGLRPHDLEVLALGALFHDFGELKYPMETLLKKRCSSSAIESNSPLRKHPRYGREMLTSFERFPYEALDIISQHHERLDGSGYPLGLRGESIAPLAKIVMVADEYDELCNPSDPAKSLIPSEALSYLYAKRRGALCKDAIVTLIRQLGVYPPGSLVLLSNDAYGLVTSVNVHARLRPIVMVYSEEIPREEAMIIDLSQEEELAITQAIRPCDLPRNVRDYLNPRRVISYAPSPSSTEPQAEPDAMATVTSSLHDVAAR